MSDKNYIEKVTNLKRETKKYVPLDLFMNVLERLETEATVQDTDEQEITDYIQSCLYKAKELVKIIPVLEDNKEEKLVLDVCPYCGHDMMLDIVDTKPRNNRYYGQRAGVRYMCSMCGSISPEVAIARGMLDSDVVKKAIKDYIEDASNCFEDNE